MTSPSESLRITESEIPGIKSLRDTLGYGKGTTRCKEFNNTTKEFLGTYMSPDGLPGYEFRLWSRHHSELETMTNVFLEDKGYGLRFWPDGTVEKPVYPKHRNL